MGANPYNLFQGIPIVLTAEFHDAAFEQGFVDISTKYDPPISYIIVINNIPVLFKVITQKPDKSSHDFQVTTLEWRGLSKNLFCFTITKDIF